MISISDCHSRRDCCVGLNPSTDNSSGRNLLTELNDCGCQSLSAAAPFLRAGSVAACHDQFSDCTPRRSLRPIPMDDHQCRHPSDACSRGSRRGKILSKGSGKFFPRAQDESRVPDAVQRSPSDAKHHLVRCSAGPGHMGPDQPNEQTKRRALRKPSLVCADLLAQGKRATSPPLPARRPNLFDAACVTTSPAVEKTGERRSARTLAALWRSPSA